MDEDDIVERFEELFPKLYADTVSYSLTSKDSVYIYLKDGRTMKFQIMNNGFSLITL